MGIGGYIAQSAIAGRRIQQRTKLAMSISAVNKLVIMRASRKAVPDGGGFEDAAQSITSKSLFTHHLPEARKWVEEAIFLVRSSPGGEKFESDEEVAGEIIRQLELKKGKQCP